MIFRSALILGGGSVEKTIVLPVNVPKEPLTFDLQLPQLTFTIDLPQLTFTFSDNMSELQSIVFGDEITRSIALTPLIEELGITIADITDLKLTFNNDKDATSSVLTKSVTDSTLTIDVPNEAVLVSFVSDDYLVLEAKETYKLALQIFFASGSPTAIGNSLYIEPQLVPD